MAARRRKRGPEPLVRPARVARRNGLRQGRAQRAVRPAGTLGVRGRPGGSSLPVAFAIAAGAGYLLARRALSPVSAMTARARQITAASARGAPARREPRRRIRTPGGGLQRCARPPPAGLRDRAPVHGRRVARTPHAVDRHQERRGGRACASRARRRSTGNHRQRARGGRALDGHGRQPADALARGLRARRTCTPSRWTWPASPARPRATSRCWPKRSSSAWRSRPARASPSRPTAPRCARPSSTCWTTPSSTAPMAPTIPPGRETRRAQALLEVVDDGPGIAAGAPAADLRLVLPSGHVAARGIAAGPGCGLSIARWAVEANGGRSRGGVAPSHGSTFRHRAARGERTDYAVIEGEGDMKKTLALTAARRVHPGARGSRSRAAGAIQAGGSRSLAVKEASQKAEKEDDEKETKPKKAGRRSSSRRPCRARSRRRIRTRSSMHSAQETENGKTIYEIESVDKGLNRDPPRMPPMAPCSNARQQIKEAHFPAPFIAALNADYNPRRPSTKRGEDHSRAQSSRSRPGAEGRPETGSVLPCPMESPPRKRRPEEVGVPTMTKTLRCLRRRGPARRRFTVVRPLARGRRPLSAADRRSPSAPRPARTTLFADSAAKRIYASHGTNVVRHQHGHQHGGRHHHADPRRARDRRRSGTRQGLHQLRPRQQGRGILRPEDHGHPLDRLHRRQSATRSCTSLRHKEVYTFNGTRKSATVFDAATVP